MAWPPEADPSRKPSPSLGLTGQSGEIVLSESKEHWRLETGTIRPERWRWRDKAASRCHPGAPIGKKNPDLPFLPLSDLLPMPPIGRIQPETKGQGGGGYSA